MWCLSYAVFLIIVNVRKESKGFSTTWQLLNEQSNLTIYQAKLLQSVELTKIQYDRPRPTLLKPIVIRWFPAPLTWSSMLACGENTSLWTTCIWPPLPPSTMTSSTSWSCRSWKWGTWTRCWWRKNWPNFGKIELASTEFGTAQFVIILQCTVGRAGMVKRNCVVEITSQYTQFLSYTHEIVSHFQSWALAVFFYFSIIKNDFLHFLSV